MNLAFEIAEWSSCYKPERNIGAVIVRNKRILTTGYNGAPAGMQSCVDRMACLRNDLGIRSGERHELCYAIHAEQNAIIQAARLGVAIDGATMYCTHQPCAICAKMIINAGISRLVYCIPYPDSFAQDILETASITVEQIDCVPPQPTGRAYTEHPDAPHERSACREQCLPADEQQVNEGGLLCAQDSR